MTTSNMYLQCPDLTDLIVIGPLTLIRIPLLSRFESRIAVSTVVTTTATLSLGLRRPAKSMVSELIHSVHLHTVTKRKLIIIFRSNPFSFKPSIKKQPEHRYLPQYTIKIHSLLSAIQPDIYLTITKSRTHYLQ